MRCKTCIKSLALPDHVWSDHLDRVLSDHSDHVLSDQSDRVWWSYGSCVIISLRPRVIVIVSLWSRVMIRYRRLRVIRSHRSRVIISLSHVWSYHSDHVWWNLPHRRYYFAEKYVSVLYAIVLLAVGYICDKNWTAAELKRLKMEPWPIYAL
jgi:hypothetical protein